MKSIGIIGVGAMGRAVARHLLSLGHKVYVRDIREEAMADMTRLGATACHSPAELAERCDVVIVLVVNTAQIEEVLFGENGAVERLAPGSAVLISSTISPKDAHSIAERLKRRGLHALDAPISGGPAKAEAGTMSMMLAAEEVALDVVREVLPLLSNTVFNVSTRPGDGARFKLLNNILAAVSLCAGAEVMALGKKMGLDTERLLDVISHSSGASWVVQDRMPRALAGDFAPRAAMRILAKDVGLFMDLAREEQCSALMGTQANQIFQDALASGLGEEDDAALLKLFLQKT